MDLDTKYDGLREYIDTNFSTREKYIILANYLFEMLREVTKEDDDKTNEVVYFYEDLLDYNYVAEYLHYNPRDEVLLLAHSAHTILFLSTLGDS
jgi:hypothetical protein